MRTMTGGRGLRVLSAAGETYRPTVMPAAVPVPGVIDPRSLLTPADALHYE